MATVAVDAEGRLVRLSRVVDPVTLAGRGVQPVNWSRLFAEAGLDEQDFIGLDAAVMAVVPHDSARAWEPRATRHRPLRITAAALDGSVVYFDVAGTDASSLQERTAVTTGRASVGEQVLWLFIVAAFIAMAVVARRNLRAGEGDRSNARKLVIFIACGGTLSAVFRAHHVPLAVEEAAFLLGVIGWSLAWGGFSWLAYIGFEPYARRQWPRTLISWTRLLAGRMGDPLVGRHVLIGTLVGVVLSGMLVARFVLARQSLVISPAEPALESLVSGRLLAWVVAFSALDALQVALGTLFFVVLIGTAVRKEWFAIIIFSVMAAPLSSGGAANLAGFGWAFATAAIVVAVVMRVGLLAGAVALFNLRLLTYVALTGDPSSWYFDSTVAVLLLVIGLAMYGFIVALAGKPVLGITPSDPIRASAR
jgi:serine/threonine-protein kinase